MRDSDGGTSLIGYHPSIAETAAKAMLDRRLIGHKVGSYEKVEKQKTYLDSRVDFVLVNDSDGVLTLVEVKNVVGADYFVGEVPAERCEVGVYTRERRLPSDGRHAIFPHGAAKPGLGVVSERAIKHVHGLTLLQGSTDAATGYSVRCMVLFIINRSDCEAFGRATRPISFSPKCSIEPLAGAWLWRPRRFLSTAQPEMCLCRGATRHL